MARECEITGKSTQIGGRYSNRTRATQFNLNKTVLVDISVKGLRHIKKNGALKTLKKAGIV
jgi:ribosomal protein L28